MRAAHVAVVISLLAVAGPARAVEGKWLPEQVPKLDPAMLKGLGLALPPEKLWDPKTGTGLLSAAVNLNGCSGAFISAEGLVITNHHCVFGIIAEHSTKERNLLETGFVAKSRSDELPGTTARLRLPVRFTDVTDEVHAAAAGAANDVEVYARTDKKKKELVAACEAQPGARCDVATYYGGLRHVMMVQRELTDVRLVYAPPRAVGEYGGEVDNWMWPRHTGDFAIVRAYVPLETPAPSATSAPPTTTTTATDPKTHAPFRPAFFFPLAKQGVQPGDFVMVLGYPGTTVRERLAEEMAYLRDKTYPWLIAWGDAQLAVLDAVTDPQGAIAVAPLKKSQHNRRKNADGQLVGIARGDLVAHKRASDAAVLTFATAKEPDSAKAHALLLTELLERDATFERDMLLSQAFSSSRALSIAVRLARMQSERDKPDLERDENYMERERQRNEKELVRDEKALFVPADKQLLSLFIERALALPPTQRLPAVDALFGKAKTAKARSAIIDGLYKKTKVLAQKTRDPLLTQSRAALAKLPDPLLSFALALNTSLDDKKRDDDRKEGFSLRVRPAWMQAVLDHAGKPIAPDANRSLRVTFATVQGYRPRDGLIAGPLTTLEGLVAKHTGAEPFAAPARVLDAAAKGAHKSLPVNFLADADTTGGNSGSPVVNGRGELVGVNFDRVWENVANDFGYNPDVARNVSVDVRYVLWLMRDVDGAHELLRELGQDK